MVPNKVKRLGLLVPRQLARLGAMGQLCVPRPGLSARVRVLAVGTGHVTR